ncbi:DoxX family protein [Cohnella caldifontis]|uniref:DoxX family protein n=1 Tax=Cohnella caldifontis TaxID=3027471 RepID=UPI0023EABC8C|nr:DoxX family protein [Cohnella sp. YIM B05605]
MKKVRIAYWTVTTLFSLLMLFAAVPAIMGEASTVELITEHLGYPDYFVFFSGIVKVIGLAAILIPGFPRLKEWAYAGMAFDLVGVVYSGLASGEPVASNLPMLVYFLLLAGSYVLYHKLNAAAGAAAADAGNSKQSRLVGAGG